MLPCPVCLNKKCAVLDQYDGDVCDEDPCVFCQYYDIEYWNKQRPNLTVIAKELYAPQWVKNDYDSRPPSNVRVIVSYYDQILGASYDAGGEGWYIDGVRGYRNGRGITHWMLMPQPPEVNK